MKKQWLVVLSTCFFALPAAWAASDWNSNTPDSMDESSIYAINPDPDNSDERRFDRGDRDRGYRISCHSYGHRYNSCSLRGPVRDVRLWNQISEASCIQGRTWGWDNRRIWVRRGCRGVFWVRTGFRGGPGGPGGDDGRDGGRDGGDDGGRDGGRDGGNEDGRDSGRDGGNDGRRDDGHEGGHGRGGSYPGYYENY